MTLAFEILFVLLVAADTFYTYKAIRSGKAKEAAWCKRYIGNVPLTIIITVIFAALVLLLAELSGFYLPMIGAAIAFGYGAFRAREIWHG